MSVTHPHLTGRKTSLLLTGIIAIAVVGYFVGVDAGVPREDYDETAAQAMDVLGSDQDSVSDEVIAAEADLVAGSAVVIPAAAYSEMRQAELGSIAQSKPSLERIHSGNEYQRCISCHNPHTAGVKPNEQDKLESLAIRASRRAFNGAPPVIPHAIERTNDAACYACHGEGALVGQRVANRMSHGPLPNCLQCHVAPPPQPFANVEPVVANSFVGLPAPIAGERAFPGAPPVIPHSTWMRERCLSCHGGVVGWPGLEVTHRWRTNCVQCHASSATLEQAVAATTDVTEPATALAVSPTVR